MRWFVTTKGYKPAYVLYGPRTGELLGTFLNDSRCVGYFDTENEAVQCVIENWNDIWEYSYSYAIVEPQGPGLYPHDGMGNERFFWWNDGYMEINRPHWAESVCNWSIG